MGPMTTSPGPTSRLSRNPCGLNFSEESPIRQEVKPTGPPSGMPALCAAAGDRAARGPFGIQRDYTDPAWALRRNALEWKDRTAWGGSTCQEEEPTIVLKTSRAGFPTALSPW